MTTKNMCLQQFLKVVKKKMFSANSFATKITNYYNKNHVFNDTSLFGML